MNDSDLLNFLEERNCDSKYTGLCIMRDSTTGRGWRLHEAANGFSTVREAIEDYKKSYIERKK